MVKEKAKFFDKCPYCNLPIGDIVAYCPKCGKALGYDPWTVIAPSGTVHEYSSTSSGTATFSSISDIFDEQEENEDAVIQEITFIGEPMKIPTRDLEHYVKLDFLKIDKEGNYTLTERGKKKYRKNREFERDWNEYQEE